MTSLLHRERSTITLYAIGGVRHFRSVVMPCRFTRTNAHAHQCCIFQSYAKTVPSRIKLTMKLTMREPASMKTDTWSRRVTSDFYSALEWILFYLATKKA